MKTIIKYLVLLVCFIMIGCTTQVEPEKPKSVEKIAKWNPDKKQYWVALIFAKMTHDPKIREMLLPHHLYEVVICAIDIYEKEYDLEYFVKNFGQVPGKLSPEHAAVVRNVTFGCTQKQLILQRQELLEKSIDPKDTI